ncbi:MAG: DUF1287 domain-containing protein [Actinomycetota bacterium]
MEEGHRTFNIKHFLIIIFILLIILAVVLSINQFTLRKEYEPPTAAVDMLPRYRLLDLDYIETDGVSRDWIEDAKMILEGAKKQVEIGAKNIMLMPDEPNYYHEGDPPQHMALSTDIIARAYKAAGYDLRELVHEDITQNFDQYPLRELWGQSYADPNIDYRRIQNLEIFFRRNALELTASFDPSDEENLEQWLPGDVVFFDMSRDGYTDNAGIISDNTTRLGIPKVIYNHSYPGYTCEENILGQEMVTGHYRYPR